MKKITLLFLASFFVSIQFVYSQTCLGISIICNDLPYDVIVKVKVDSSDDEGIGPQVSGQRRDSIITKRSKSPYSLLNRVPKKSLMLTFYLKDLDMANSGRYGAKLALGGLGTIVRSKDPIKNIPHHFEFKMSEKMIGYSELIIHFTDLDTIRSQIAELVYAPIVIEEQCEIDEYEMKCLSKIDNDKSEKFRFNKNTDGAIIYSNKFIQFVEAEKEQELDKDIITIFTDVNPNIKHPPGGGS